MAFLLSEAAKLTQDLLLRGVIETIVTESALMRYLPFLTVTGSAVTYNQEQTLPSAEWHAVNGDWTTSEPTLAQKTATLKILGGDADVDAFLQQTYANRNDIQALVVQSKAKALAYAFNQAFFYGDSTGGSNQFDGLALLAGAPGLYGALSATNRAFVQATGAGSALTLDAMDQLVDAVKPGRPDALFMSKRTRRKLSSLRRASGSTLETGLDAFGRHVTTYDGIPVEIDENILDTETWGSSINLCSSIFAVKFGYNTGVVGLQNGGVQAIRVGDLETKDALRVRLKWYCGLAVMRSISYCALRGVLGS
jgi:HK97 family phage major capsid protein